MLAMFYLMLGLFFSAMFLNRPEAEHDFARRVGTPIGASIIAYQNQALSICYNKTTSQITCPAGKIALTTRTGADAALRYGTAFVSVTDGSTYIATTVMGPRVAGIAIDRNKMSWIVDYMNRLTDNSATIGVYSTRKGGIVMVNTGNVNGGTPFVVNAIYMGTPMDGQPFIINKTN